MSEDLVSVNQVSRYYGRCCAVDGVSFSVRRGEVLGLLGLNGSGKSSTMFMLAGVIPVSAGSISVAGYDVFESPKQAKQHIGFLPDQPPLYKGLTVNEYLTYAARLRGLRQPALEQAQRYAKQRCGLVDVGRRLISNLSKGMQQRVGIAQAIIHKPDLLILDEPTMGLDINQAMELRMLIKELGSQHSVILSTHILSEVQDVCDRFLIIHQGRLVLDRRIGGLQQDADTLLINVALHHPPSLATLHEIAGVDRVEAIGANRFKLYCQSDAEVTDHIINASVTGQWRLYEMQVAEDMLEETFMRLTRGEDRALPKTVV